MEGYTGEVRMFAGNFPPRNWAYCLGQLININENQALYSLLGTAYGGDGRATFGLPDLRGRLPVQPGQPQLPGSIPSVVRGQPGGNVQTQVSVPLPEHTHAAVFTGTGGGGGGGSNPNGTLGVEVSIAVANTNTSNTTNPQDNVIAVPKFSGLGTINAFTAPANATPNAQLGGVAAKLTGQVAPGGGGITGGSVTIVPSGDPGARISLPTIPPYLGVSFIICVNGIYPSRN